MVMDSIVSSQGHKPHAVCIPFPAQGHLNPMLQLAKLLHSQGFHITFVNTEHNHNRLMQASGPTTVAGSVTFRFETIPDGLPPTDSDSTQDIVLLTASVEQHCLIPFKELIARLNKAGDVPPVSCIVSDAVMLFTFEAAQELGIPQVQLWTSSACGLLGYIQTQNLLDHGTIPFKDANFAKNGDLDKVLDWTIPSMQGIRVKDLPSTIRATDPNDFVLNFIIRVIQNCKRAPAIMINSFDALDDDVLQSIIASDFPPLYTIGPLQLLLDSSIDSIDEQTKSMSTNLWKEDTLCLKWLDSYDSNSVVYVNFGSITVLTNDQLVEFAWGLANSNHPFLWITRPNLVVGESTALPPEFLAVTKERGLITNWCDQKQVLGHPAIGGFLTHCGWNSTLESISNGVPMICWPFFADQQTNCWICCNKWGVGLEIDENVKRDEVEKQVRELMEGEKGKEVKRKAMELRELAHEAIAAPKGSSYNNFEKVIKMLGSTSKQAS